MVRMIMNDKDLNDSVHQLAKMQLEMMCELHRFVSKMMTMVAVGIIVFTGLFVFSHFYLLDRIQKQELVFMGEQ
jgi:uncharacterized membrane protein YgdD (TMEM256/DUF423 family)